MESNRRRLAAIIFAILLVVFVIGRLAYQTNPDVQAWVDGLLGNETVVVEAVPEDAEKPAEDVGTVAGSDTGASPEDSTETGEDVGPVVPALDVVRVEPSGDAVFAGRVQPGWDIELRANGEPIGQAKANESGEWAIVIEQPLGTGPSDITLHAKSPDGAMTVNAPDRVAIDIAEGRKSQPLVVVTSPDGPSEVLQTPEAVAEVLNPDVGSGEQVASDTETVIAENATAENASDAGGSGAHGAVAGADESESSAEEVAETARETSAESAERPANPGNADVQVADAEDPSSSLTENDTADQTGTTDDIADQPATSGEGEQVETAAADDGSAPSEKVEAETGQSVADTASADDESQTATSEATVTIEAVENDTSGQLFVSGRAEPGEAVRAYSDNTVLGEAIADASGRWSVEAERPATEAAQPITVRADLLNSVTGKPAARAQVSFERLDPGETIVTLIPVPTERAGSIPSDYDRLIVKRGDNLWRIARNLYGEGIRFTNIYVANQDQIQNPDLIFPGQVFAVPKRASENEG